MVELAPPAVTPFPAPSEEGTSSDIYASLSASPIAADMEPKVWSFVPFFFPPAIILWIFHHVYSLWCPVLFSPECIHF